MNAFDRYAIDVAAWNHGLRRRPVVVPQECQTLHRLLTFLFENHDQHRFTIDQGLAHYWHVRHRPVSEVQNHMNQFFESLDLWPEFDRDLLYVLRDLAARVLIFFFDGVALDAQRWFREFTSLFKKHRVWVTIPPLVPELAANRSTVVRACECVLGDRGNPTETLDQIEKMLFKAKWSPAFLCVLLQIRQGRRKCHLEDLEL